MRIYHTRKLHQTPFPIIAIMFTLQSYISRQNLVSTRKILRSIHNFFSTMIIQPESSSQQPPRNDPPPFDPSQQSIPISYPLKTLEELENRSYFDSFHYPFNKSSVPLRSDSISMPDRGRVLVCHDMAGGYTEGDRWVQGGGDSEAYAIWHWYLMDVFVYFSHSLVTIPPPCWTNAAHTHGVKVLGTFITEWDDGKVICNKMLSTKESARLYAELLAELAVAMGFDGWLINMEVSLDVGQIPNMKEFVSHLTQTLHSSMPGSLIIWYDSVTIKGDLNWQDQLNDLNKPFFDLCDGIFVNYTWKEDYPKRSADVAGDRKYDVYMGIDVFGRGTYGGGQWTTNVALDVIKKNDVSAAIFAPGWVYETKQPPDFQTAQNRWWALIEQSWGVLQKYPRSLPFYSNFDQGRGYHFSVDGRKVSAAPWCNISCQSFQPFLEFSEDHTPDTIQVHVDFKEASYSGGGNITFKGSLEHGKYFTTRLFQGELHLGNSPLHFTYSVKLDGSSLIGLSLEFASTTSERKSVLLAAHGRTLQTMNRFLSKFSSVIMPHKVTLPETPSGWVIQQSCIAMNGYTLTEINSVCYKFEPALSGEKINYGTDSHQLHVLSRDPKEYFAGLGHILIKSKEQNEEFPPSKSWLVDGQYVKWTSSSEGFRALSVKLIWKLKNSINFYYPKYNIYIERGAVLEYLGEAQVEALYVSELVVPSDTPCVKFRIQVCGADGTCQKLDDSPLFQLDVEDSHNNSRLMKMLRFSLTKVTTNRTLVFNSFSLLVLTFSFIFFVLSFVVIWLSFSSVM